MKRFHVGDLVELNPEVINSLDKELLRSFELQCGLFWPHIEAGEVGVVVDSSYDTSYVKWDCFTFPYYISNKYIRLSEEGEYSQENDCKYEDLF